MCLARVEQSQTAAVTIATQSYRCYILSFLRKLKKVGIFSNIFDRILLSGALVADYLVVVKECQGILFSVTIATGLVSCYSNGTLIE